MPKYVHCNSKEWWKHPNIHRKENGEIKVVSTEVILDTIGNK